ncbi:MAG: 6-phosphofructokinase [Candidatus Aminicenantes bacterium]|nr:6-phosphofructokinase [Candidatus Aminicenantes bacterium]
MKTRIGILTGGGDVQALNAVLAAAQKKAHSLGIELLGFIRGWEGVLKEEWVGLSSLSFSPRLGGTVLKSSRLNFQKIPRSPEIVLEKLAKNRITGLIVIGGEDTLSNAFLIKSFPLVLISKTIDNDVGQIGPGDREFKKEEVFNYFTLGFPTAAGKIVSFVSLKEGLRTTAYSHERIIVVESMGMHAGWLALASGLGHPDFIIIPEFPLNYDLLLEKVIRAYESQRHVIIVVAEGARWEDGSNVYSEKDESEEFAHPRFGGSAAALKKRLKNDLSPYFDTRNVNSVNPSYLYRSGAPCPLDLRWAQRIGEKAVSLLAGRAQESSFLAIQKIPSGFRLQIASLSRFGSIDELHRFVDNRFYDPREFRITAKGMAYLKPIVKEISPDDSYGIRKPEPARKD